MKAIEKCASFNHVLFFILLIGIIHCNMNIGLAGVSYVNPGESIQAAINAASDDDVIIVNPGIYVETLYFFGKNIMLLSSDPYDPSVVTSTIIDGVDLKLR